MDPADSGQVSVAPTQQPGETKKAATVSSLVPQENLGVVGVSPEWVHNFLRFTGDKNPYHQPPHNYMPGMAYLALFSKHLTEPISHLDIAFRGAVQFPVSVPIARSCFVEKKEGEPDKRKVVLYAGAGDGGKPYCRATFRFEENAERGDNSGLEEFAGILGVGMDNPNLGKILATCRIPGELMNQLSSDSNSSKMVSIYSSQELAFLGDTRDLEFMLRVERGKRGKLDVKTAYIRGSSVAAIGEAVVYQQPLQA